MALTSLRDLFVHTLKDVYYAEKQLVKALPQMADKAESTKLADAFRSHAKETQGHVDRLEEVFDLLGEKASGVKCHAIEGIIKEAHEIMDDCDDADTLDAGLIAAAQAAEHYEITRYGTLASWAETLGETDALHLLRDTLDEEKDADSRLSRLGEDHLNKQAMA